MCAFRIERVWVVVTTEPLPVNGTLRHVKTTATGYTTAVVPSRRKEKKLRNFPTGKNRIHGRRARVDRERARRSRSLGLGRA